MRIRLPGGHLTPPQLDALASHGADVLELTGRGNIELSPPVEPAADPGVSLPDIVASPLTGRVGAFGDVRGLVRELDTAVHATGELARLPRGFGICLDDGRGDVAGLGTDLGAQLDGARARLLVDGRTTNLTVDIGDVVDALVGAAVRATESPDPTHYFDDVVLGDTAGAHTRPPIGWLEQNDGSVTLGAGVPLGRLSAELAQYVVAIDRPVAVTPWRSILIFDLDEGSADVVLRVLAPRGLVFDADSPHLSWR